MAFTSPINIATNNISTLDPEPNEVSGLTASQLQALFDKFGVDFKAWFINTHLAELASIVLGSSASENLGSPAIAGLTGTSIYSQIVSLKAAIDAVVAGVIPLGSINEDMLNFLVATQGELNAMETAYQTADNSIKLRMYMGV
jgi:hypothetical protein